MVLDASLLNTQHYKVRIKGKVEQSREGVAPPPLHLGVVAIEKGAFGLPSTMVANFTFIYHSSNTLDTIVRWVISLTKQSPLAAVTFFMPLANIAF